MKPALLMLIATVAYGQTAVNVNAVRCPLVGSAALILPVGIPGSVGGSPIVMFSCVQLESGWRIDSSTTPPTLRLPPAPVAPANTALTFVREVPTGTIDGSNAMFILAAPPKAGPLLYRGGLLLSPCSTTPCNGDYTLDAAGQTITFLTSRQTAAGVSTIPESGALIVAVYWK